MPNPNQYSDQNAWMKAFMHRRRQEHPHESHEQSIAIGLNMWKSRHKGKRHHKTAEVIYEITKVADYLDDIGLNKQATELDEILKDLMQ